MKKITQVVVYDWSFRWAHTDGSMMGLTLCDRTEDEARTVAKQLGWKPRRWWQLGRHLDSDDFIVAYNRKSVTRLVDL